MMSFVQSRPLPRPVALLAAALLTSPCAAQPHGYAVDGNAAVYFDAPVQIDAPPRSFVFEHQPRFRSPIPAEFPLAPEFERREGSSTATIRLPEGTRLYGLGARPGGPLRNGYVTPEGESEPAPWLIAVQPDGLSFGVLADTTWPCRIDLREGIRLTSPAPRFSVVVFRASSLVEAIIALHEKNGRLEMPPLWAIGSQQFAGDSTESLRAAARWLQEHSIPADALVTSSGASVLNAPWEGKIEANPAFAELKEQGRRVLTGLPLAVPVNPESTWDQAWDKDKLWINTADGEPYRIETPSGLSRIPDLSTPAARDLFASGIARVLAHGYAGVGLGDAISDATPLESLHVRGDGEANHPGPFLQVRRSFNPAMLNAARKSFHGEETGRRPFVWTSTPGPATQRYAAPLFPIDPRTAKAPDIIRTAVNLSLTGQPLTGAALTHHPALADDAHARRIAALAATLPVSRIQAPPPTDDASALSPEAITTFKAALDRRSRLVPYYYTLCFDAFFRCFPIVRPIFFADPSNPDLHNDSSSFLLGNDLLVVPAADGQAAPPACPLPGQWRRVTLLENEPAELPSLFLRPGAILPIGPRRAHTGESPTDPLTLIVNLDEHGSALGRLYEDDGDGYAFYRNQARITGYRAEVRADGLYITLAALDGALPIPRRKLDVRILTDHGEVTGSGSERGTLRLPWPPPPPPPPPPPQP